MTPIPHTRTASDFPKDDHATFAYFAPGGSNDCTKRSLRIATPAACTVSAMHPASLKPSEKHALISSATSVLHAFKRSTEATSSFRYPKKLGAFCKRQRANASCAASIGTTCAALG